MDLRKNDITETLNDWDSTGFDGIRISLSKQLWGCYDHLPSETVLARADTYILKHGTVILLIEHTVVWK
jgi:hypothetical protein